MGALLVSILDAAENQFVSNQMTVRWDYFDYLWKCRQICHTVQKNFFSETFTEYMRNIFSAKTAIFANDEEIEKLNLFIKNREFNEKRVVVTGTQVKVIFDGWEEDKH